MSTKEITGGGLMNVFKEGNSLSMLNHELAMRIPKHQLLGDLPLSLNDFHYLAAKLKELFFGTKFQINNKSEYEECFAVFVVFCAVYEYDQRKFWEPVEKYLGELGQYSRTELYDIFSHVLEKFHLNKFENESEEGFRYVTPILCHAGIPINGLDSYFEAISNTINDPFYDDFDVDDYLAYFKNKAEVTVRRYLKLADKRDAYNFIQSTRKLILYDSDDEDGEIDTGNYIRMIGQISNWKEKPKVKKSLQARKKVQITAPKVKIDLEGVGVYCELPRIVVKECYDPYLIWEISMDGSTYYIKADFLIRNGVFVSEEKIYALKPANTYMITLKIDDEVISKWDIQGVNHSYIAFEHNGNLIKKQTLPNYSVILILKNNRKILDKGNLPIFEFPQIPLWFDYNVYSIDLSNTQVLRCTHFNIPVNSEDKPVLIGGKTLFDQENSRTYTKLPKVRVPVISDGDWHLVIKYQFENTVFQKLNVIVKSGHSEILLNEYIEKDAFGQYEIKIWNRTGFNEKFFIEFVPNSKILFNQNDYWPHNVYGYKNNIQTIQTSKEVEIDVYNAEKINEINNGDNIVYKFKTREKDRFLIGEYKYYCNGKVFKTPLKLSILPIAWGIIEDENEVIEYVSKMYTLTKEDFTNSTDPYLLFAFGFHQFQDIQKIKLQLIDTDLQIILENEFQIAYKEGLRIPLNPYLFEIRNNNGASHLDYNLWVSLINSAEDIAASFIVARFQNEMVIRNCKLTQIENEVIIDWEEEGTKTGREIVMVNFVKPWHPPYHFKVDDKKTRLKININHLKPGIYKFLIQKESENLFFDEIEADICTLSNFQKGIIKGRTEEDTSPMEKVLSEILKTRFLKAKVTSKRLLKLQNDIKNLSVQMPEDMNMLSYAYILHNRFPPKRVDKRVISKIFDSVFDLFFDNKNEAFRYVLDSKFSNDYKKQLLQKCYCINLTCKPKINEIQMQTLAKVDEDAYGFIQLIQSENKVFGLNWAGISDIRILKEEDLFGEENHSFLSEENLGKNLYIEQYFQYLYQSIQLPRNLSKSTADFLREFQNQQDVQETKIFGKTRLQLLVEWREQTKKDLNHVKEQLVEVLNICSDTHLKKQFMDVFQALSKRKEADEIGYYIGLIALYASFIRNGLMSETKEFRKLLGYTIEKCNKLYYRDSIIIELYMQKERGYTWV
jgi:hypothetical protein